MKYTKLQVAFISMAVILLVLAPVKENWAKKPKDDFPLSYYPMFSNKRGETYGFYYVVGYDSNNKRIDINYKLTGTGGFNQVRRQIRKAGKNEAGIPFLKKVASRIPRRDKLLYAKLARLELVKGYYHMERYFLENDTLPVLERKIASLLIEQQ